MPEGTINLLPRDRAHGVRRTYFFRLAALAAFMLGALVVMNGLMLVPAYAFVSADIKAKEQHLASLSSATLTPGQSSASTRLTTLVTDAKYLAQLSSSPTMSGATALVLSVPHAGIKLNSFSLAPLPSGALSMRVSGVADTRESLHSYVVALEGEPWVKSADLPISAYAADTNVSFTVTLTGTFVSP
jgi:hypothetical protein